jgi:hypothetical protein
MTGLTLCEQVSLGFMILHLFSCYPSNCFLWEISLLFHRSVSVLWFTIVTSLCPCLCLSLCVSVQYGYIVVMGIWWIEAMQSMCSQVQLDLQTQISNL